MLLINMEGLEFRSRYTWLSVLLNSSNKQSSSILFELILASMLEKVQARYDGMGPLGKDYERTY